MHDSGLEDLLQTTTIAAYSASPQENSPGGPLALKLTLSQQGLLSLLLLIIIASIVACHLFYRAVQRCNARRTVFNGLLLVRAQVLQANLVTELTLFAVILQHWWTPPPYVCLVFNGLSGFFAFSITYLTAWLGLVRLLLLAVSCWTPRHGWRITNARLYILIGLIYAPCATLFVLRYQPNISFYVCAGLPIENQPNPNTTALGVLLLISTAANTLLLYTDARLPAAPPRGRNVVSARTFAMLTLCEQLLVLLWGPAAAMTAGITRAMLTRVLMISQAGLLDTLGLALLSPQLRAALLGGRRLPAAPRLTRRVAPLPVIRLELI